MRPRCAVCGGETIEIRAKLVCRGCGIILETCCEGGPMGCGGTAASDDRSADPVGDGGGGVRDGGDVSGGAAGMPRG